MSIKYNLEDVFKLSGLPTVTFVEPTRYNEILIALRTEGRGVIIEGSSGIGKTMCVKHILNKLGLTDKCYYLTPRNPDDNELISAFTSWDRDNLGVIIIDDFHMVPLECKVKIGNLMKVLADEENTKSKLILIGINSTGKSIVDNINDLLTRVSIFSMESNPDDKILELIEKGEHALNIAITDKNAIVKQSCGSFYICQDICHRLCAHAGILDTQYRPTKVNECLTAITEIIISNLSKVFDDKLIAFAQGNRIRKGTRPYYNILKWFSENNSMTINLLQEAKKRSLYFGGMKQVIDKDYITRLISKHSFLESLFFYNRVTKELCIEDPKLLFYLRNVDWRHFEARAGFDELESILPPTCYDIAISFTGKQRNIARMFYNYLSESLSVFYDNDHQHEILGQDADAFLIPIFETNSKYVLALFSEDYPYRYWPRIEFDAYKKRLRNKEVLPIYVGSPPPEPSGTELGFQVISGDILKDQRKLKKRIKDISDIIIEKFK